MSDLTAGQRAALAVEDGGRPEHAAARGVPYPSVKLARVVRDRSPGTFAELRAGRIGVTKAHKLACGRPTMSGEVLPLFDYADLEPAAKAVVVEAAAIIRLHGRRAAESIVAIGEQLARVKGTLGHGHYLGWLRVEFDWSEDTAERFRNVYKLAGRIPQIAEYQVDVSALYLLAKPSTPEPVIEASVEKAAAGERVTHGAVKDALREEKGRIERAFAPRTVDEEIAEPEPPDPQQGEAFALAAAVGGRLRDIEQIMDGHPAREVAWAFRNSPMSSPARFLAQARRVAAFLAEIETALEDTGEQAA